MPLYTFKNLDSGEVYEDIVPFSGLDEYCVERGVERLISAPMIVSGINAKPDAGFRDVLKRIKKANVGSTIDDF